MKDDKILNNEELDEVAGGGIFWNQDKQLYKVGDRVIVLVEFGDRLAPVVKEMCGRITKCLGLQGLFFGTYEYMVKLDNGMTTQVTQAKIKKI